MMVLACLIKNGSHTYAAYGPIDPVVSDEPSLAPRHALSGLVGDLVIW